MNMRARGRRSTALAGGLGVALVLVGCGASETSGGGGGGTAEGSDRSNDCPPGEWFGDLEGVAVDIYTAIDDPEDQPHNDCYVPFEECTSIDVNYEGSREFEA